MDLREQDDASLAALALEGRREAWDALIARHERRVLLTLLARGIRMDRARDIAQDAWARLIAKQREGALERIELPGLAIKQAMFLAIDEGRRPKIDATESEAIDPAPTIEDRLVTRAQLERASAELDRMPRKAQRIFEIVYEEPERPHADVARTVGLSLQRFRQTLCEVRAKLRAALAEERIETTFEKGVSRD